MELKVGDKAYWVDTKTDIIRGKGKIIKINGDLITIRLSNGNVINALDSEVFKIGWMTKDQKHDVSRLILRLTEFLTGEGNATESVRDIDAIRRKYSIAAPS